jgi:hypothetical protein
VFPLTTSQFPASAAELQNLLNQSLGRILSDSADSVTIRDSSYPHLQEIRVSLDGARLHPNPPPPLSISGEIAPALQVDRLSFSAQPLLIGLANIDLSLNAQMVRFDQGKDSEGQVLLVLNDAANGKVEVSIKRASLSTLITTLAQSQASKHGITIDGVQVDLESTNSRSLSAQIRLRIRKLFLSASLVISGEVTIDEQFKLRSRNLTCRGDGPIASLACNVLTPYFRRIEAEPVPLIFLPLGNIQLRDINLALNDNLVITAEFGSTGAG